MAMGVTNAAVLVVAAAAAAVVCQASIIIIADFKYTRFIVGGNSASENQFPEIVSIQYDEKHYCGGTLIDESWVVTAAHCVYGVEPEMISVVAGTVTWATGGVRREVDGYLVHDDYNASDYLTHDVAVLRLSESMPLSDSVQLATLRQTEAEDGEVATVAGWGVRTADSLNASDTLQWVEVNVVGLENCQVAIGDYATIYDNQICAGLEDGKGECKGDSGGPLFVDGLQVGIVSWSEKPCASAGIPGIYAGIAPHLAWIRLVTGLPYV